jgi:hypothetical protein
MSTTVAPTVTLNTEGKPKRWAWCGQAAIVDHLLRA